jgi:hypothetical protein
VQQTFASEVQRTLHERERRVERREEIHAIRLDPKQRQQEQGNPQNPDEEQGGNKKRRRRLDIRI